MLFLPSTFFLSTNPNHPYNTLACSSEEEDEISVMLGTNTRKKQAVIRRKKAGDPSAKLEDEFDLEMQDELEINYAKSVSTSGKKKSK